MTDATNGEALLPVAWRFWDEEFSDWTAWSGDTKFRTLCEKLGMRCEFAYPPTASAGMVVVPAAAVQMLRSAAYSDDRETFEAMAFEAINMLAAHESQSPPSDTTPDVSERGPAIDDPRWIPVVDRLPGSDEDVWVLMDANGPVLNTEHPGYGVGKWVRRSRRHGTSRIFMCELCETGAATHWQPTDNVEGE